MKRHSSLLSFAGLMLAFLILFVAAPQEMAAMPADTNTVTTVSHTAYKIYFACELDSLDTDTSASFTLQNWDHELFATYPLTFGYKITSTAAKPRVTTLVQASLDNGLNWFTVDTVSIISDSIETYQTFKYDLNEWHAPRYRILAEGTAGNRSDAILKLTIYAWRPNKQWELR